MGSLGKRNKDTTTFDCEMCKTISCDEVGKGKTKWIHAYDKETHESRGQTINKIVDCQRATLKKSLSEQHR